MTTSATMVFGFGETVAERMHHLLRLRELQDESLHSVPPLFYFFSTRWRANSS